MKFGSVKTIASASVQKFAIASEVFVVTCVKRVVSSLCFSAVAIGQNGVKFKGKQGVLAPWHRGVYVYLVLRCTQMSKSFTSRWSQIYLKSTKLFQHFNTQTKRHKFVSFFAIKIFIKNSINMYEQKIVENYSFTFLIQFFFKIVWWN